MTYERCFKQHNNSENLNTLVENRTIYNAEFAELNIYETLKLLKKSL